MPELLTRTPRIAAVHLRTKGLQAVRSRHPWIFEDSIEKMPSGLEPGDIAVLFDRRRKLGAALVDPDSDIRLRVLAFGAGAPDIGPILFRQLAEKAAARRKNLFDENTNAWRLANGESDGFSGLAADRYADVLSVKIYSAAWLPHLENVLTAFRSVHPELTRTAIRLSREVASLPAQRRLTYEDGMLFGEPGWDGTVNWWLRTTDCCINEEGTAVHTAGEKKYDPIYDVYVYIYFQAGVRPAVWINLESETIHALFQP